MIINARYADPSKTVVAWDTPDGFHASSLATAPGVLDYLAAGGRIAPYSPPTVDPKEQAKVDLAASDGDASRFGEDALRHLIMSGQLTPNKQLAKKLADRDYLRAIIRGDIPPA